MKINFKQCGVVGVVAILSFTRCLWAQEAKPAADSPLTISRVTFSGPTAAFPHYHLAISLRWQGAAPARVTQIKMGDRKLPTKPVAIEPFAVYVNDRRLVADSEKKFVPPGAKIVVRVHYNWTPAKKAGLEVTVQSKAGKPVTAGLATTAPREGGFPLPGWYNARALVLSEEAGIERKSEPVDVCLAFEAKAMSDPAQDIRVFRLDGVAGKATPVVFQAYGLRKWDTWKGTPRYEHTSVCHLVFQADVPANGKSLYAVCYGPPAGGAETTDAPSKSDLEVSGEGLGLTIENRFYKATLSPQGQLRAVMQKGISYQLRGKRKHSYYWHKGPDTLAIKGNKSSWMYASGWSPPEGSRKIQGPLFFEIRRCGPMPKGRFLPGLPELRLEVTYRFYAGVPYILMSSRFWTVGDISVVNLRQDDIYFHKQRFTHVAWETGKGKVAAQPLENRPGVTRNYVAHLPFNVPWFGCYNEKNGDGAASVRLKSVNLGPNGEEAVTNYAGTFVLKDHWMRSIVMGYHHRFSSNGHRRNYVTMIPKGSQYIDSNAHVFFRYTSRKGLDEIVNWAKRLRTPLRINYDP